MDKRSNWCFTLSRSMPYSVSKMQLQGRPFSYYTWEGEGVSHIAMPFIFSTNFAADPKQMLFLLKNNGLFLGESNTIINKMIVTRKEVVPKYTAFKAKPEKALTIMTDLNYKTSCLKATKIKHFVIFSFIFTIKWVYDF